MSRRVSDEVEATLSLEKFFEQLTWEKLEKRIREALRYPNRSVPSEIYCPAVMDLAKDVISGIGKSAIQRKGDVVSSQEAFTFDQRVAVMRLLEAIISEFEDWKKARLSERMTPGLESPLKSLEQK